MISSEFQIYCFLPLCVVATPDLMLIKAITTASLALLSLLLVHWHEELKLLSRDHNFKYDEILLCPLERSVFPSPTFSEMVNTDFIIRSLGLIMREPVQHIPLCSWTGVF